MEPEKLEAVYNDTTMESLKTLKREELKTLSSVLSRSMLGNRLGEQYGGDRDIYKALGYKKNLLYKDFYEKFRRLGIAKRIVDAYPRATWRKAPQLLEVGFKGGKGKVSPLSSSWKKLVRDVRVIDAIYRADKLSGIGAYGVMFMGFADGLTPDKPAVPGQARRLLYLTPYSEDKATISEWETDPKNERYGKPRSYTLQTSATGTGTTSITAHWTRVIHMAEDCEENTVIGTSRLEAVFNNLTNIELLLGGSAEMFWRGAFPGFGFEMDPEAETTTEDRAAMDEQITEYVHGMRRYLQLQGVKINQLQPQAVDPTNHVAVQVDFISGTSGIPKRILFGSERGELASTQDEKNWAGRVDERRQLYAEPVILRPFIDRLMWLEILVFTEYEVIWPDLLVLDARGKAEVNEMKMRSLYNYARAPNADLIFPVVDFLRDVMDLSDDQIEERGIDVEALLRREEEQMQLELDAVDAKASQQEKTSTVREPGNGKEPKL